MDVIVSIVNRTKKRLKTDACLAVAGKWMCLVSAGVLLLSIADRFVESPLLSLQLTVCMLIGALVAVAIAAWTYYALL